jgi:hypothetical protein
MNWFQQNRLLGGFLIALGLATLAAGYFLLHEKALAGGQQRRLDTTVAELTRLRQGNPFPSGENLRRMRAQMESYRSSVLALENELKTRTLPIVPLQPNEFQTQLRQATTSVAELARNSKVRLPENFYLGFNEYATSLPNSTAAPLLGRELKAIEWLVSTIVEAHVDSLNSLSRAPLKEEKVTPPSATPPKTRALKPATTTSGARGMVESNSVDLAFSASPAAARKVLNQVASAKQQFFIVRTLVVKNQVAKGPPRGAAPQTAAASGPSGAPPSPVRPGSTPAAPGISFIVGTEHIDVAAKVEIVKFDFPQKETR